MSLREIKIISWSLTIVVSLILSFTTFDSRCWALEVDTHREINKYIAKGVLLDDYLRKQLGIQAGVESYFNQKKVSELLGDGGEFEDDGLRPRSHFLNPLTNQGLVGICYSALEWATLPVGVQGSEHYSWSDARDYYYKALTRTDKTDRDMYFAWTFRGLGQIMHLVQDMSVPAHVRDDKHLKLLGLDGDGYESWMDEPDNRRTIAQYLVTNFAFNTLFPLNVKNLFDTDQYDGTNDVITISSNSIGLAEYTNANFFSGDTINAANFPSPRTDNNNKVTLSYIGPLGTHNRQYFLKNCSDVYCQQSVNKDYHGYLLSADDLNDYWRQMLQNPTAFIPILDENVYHDYAQLLIPRAIGYSSQVLQYFFRGKLEAEFLGSSLKIKNVSTETINSGDANGNKNGTFELYYDNAQDVRTRLTDPPIAANTLAPGEVQTINYNMPTEDVKAFMLVYHGQLGDEPNAIIPLYIDSDGTVWVAGEDITGRLGLGNDYNLIRVVNGNSQPWEIVKYTPAKGLPFFRTWTWATIGRSCSGPSASTFLINNYGEMYCSGGNAMGELGIGQAIGYRVIGNSVFTVPNYYTKNFIKVQGNDWKMVITSGGVTWALKTDGTLWVTGEREGGTGGIGTFPINIFTKYDDTVWRSLYGLGSLSLGVIKEVGDNYEFYEINDSGVLTLMSTISKSDWIDYHGNMTPEEYSAADMGLGDIQCSGGPQRTFIGGSITDTYSKPSGTLWSVDEYYGFSPINEVAGNDWIFTTGVPNREVTDDGVSPPSQSTLTTGGGTIAIKAQ